MKKKISFHSTYAYPLFNTKSLVKHGGAEVQMSLWAKELAKKTEIETLCFVGNFGQKSIEEIENVKLVKTFNPGTKPIFVELIYAFIYFLRLIKYNPLVLITSGSGSLVGVIALYKVLFRKRMIYRVSHKIDVDKTWVGSNRLGFLFEFALKKADKIVCQAEYQSEILYENYSLKSEIIPNSHLIEEHEKQKNSSILFVARCEKWKNPNLFIQLAKQNSNSNFTMICPPSKDFVFFEEIKAKAQKITNLEFIEKVPFHGIQKYFDEAMVFINLSDFEGFPNTFIQAGIGKTPILSLSVNPDNFINRYECGFACNSNFELVNENMKVLLNNKKVWTEKSNNIFSYVNENHNLKLNIKKFNELTSSLI